MSAITNSFLLILVLGVSGLILFKLIRDTVWNRRLDAFKVANGWMEKPAQPQKFQWDSKLASTLGLVGALGITLVSSATAVFAPLIPIDREMVNAKSVNNKDTLTQLVQKVWNLESYGIYRGGILNSVAEGAVDDATSPSVEATSKDTNPDYIDTNSQVEGVAEGDIIKTNGHSIFYASRYQNLIRVLDVEENKELSLRTTLDLGTLYVESLYVTSTQLIVIGYTYETAAPSSKCGVADLCATMDWWGYPQGSIEVFDLDTLESEFKLVTDGFFQNHRLLQEVDAENESITHQSLFLVSSNSFWNEEDPRPVLDTTQNGETVHGVVDYDNIYYFTDTPAYQMTVLTGIQLDDYSIDAKAFLGNVQNMYVNQTSIYTVDTIYSYQEVDGVYSYDQTLQIVKYAIDIPEAKVDYVGQAKIKGYPVNQFAMDEYNGYFRIATTTSRWWWGGNTGSEVLNRLYVLAESPETDTLEVVGLLGEDPLQPIGKEGETIRSVRFNGDKAYVVTFLQTDPLYEIDVSDPTNPHFTDTVIYETGFSTYIHDWDETHLIGLGFSADENGRTNGIKISAYAVGAGEDEPLETYYLNAGDNPNQITYSWSEALYDHKALMVSPTHGILGFSIQSYGYEVIKSEDGYDYWGQMTYTSEYLVFYIDFTSEQIISDPIRIQQTPEYYYNYIDRGVYIDGVIYTLSYHQMVAYDLVNKVEVQHYYFPEFKDDIDRWAYPTDATDDTSGSDGTPE